MAKKSSRNRRTTRAAATSAPASPAAPAGTPRRRSCASLQAHFGLLDRYPEFRFNQSAIEGFTRTFMRAGRTTFRTGVIAIPVVVHVVYRVDDENISDAQIKSQIAVLNKDFTATNPDVDDVPEPFAELVGDPQIRFELARKDPDGNPSNGMTRTATNLPSFSINDGVKSPAMGGVAAWDTQRYLNIWVCTLTGTFGEGLLGYAQFPGGPADSDGVVILNTAFGTSGSASPPFDRGRTATHEIGHYLNLSHIWGETRIANCDDSDYVNDTPNQFGPNTGTPEYPLLSCNNDPHGDLFMNYMDYVDDASMFMFTKGQVLRMRATLAGARRDLGAGPLA